MIPTVKGFSQCALLSLSVICNLPCGRAGRENLLGRPSQKVDFELRLGPPNHYDKGTLPSKQDEASNPKRLKSAVRTSLKEQEFYPCRSNQESVAKFLRGDIPEAISSSAQGPRGWQILSASDLAPVDTPETMGSLLTLGGDTPFKRKPATSPVVKNMFINPTSHMMESRLQGYPGDTHAGWVWADRKTEPGYKQQWRSGARPSDMLGPASFSELQQSMEFSNENNVSDRANAHGRKLTAEADVSQPTVDPLEGGGIVMKETPVGQSKKLILRPEGRPEARKIINLESLILIRFPRVLPNVSVRKKLVTLAEAWAYNQNLDQLKEEISMLKVKFMKLVYLSERVQHMVQKLQSCFGNTMPRHEWFSEYGNRVFPDIVAMHQNHIPDNEILESQVYLVKKWASVLDFIRNIERKKPTKMLLHSDALVRVLDTMIKTRFDEYEMESLLRFTLSFINVNNISSSSNLKDETVRMIEWLMKGIVISSNLVYQQEFKNAPEVGIKFHDWSNAALTKAVKSQAEIESKVKGKSKKVSLSPQGSYYWFDICPQLGQYLERLLFYFVSPPTPNGKPPISPPDLLYYYFKNSKHIENPMTSYSYGGTITEALDKPTEKQGLKSFQDLLDTASSDVGGFREKLPWTSEKYVSENMWKFITLMLKESKNQYSFQNQFNRVLQVMRHLANMNSDAAEKWALQEISPLIIFGSKPEFFKSKMVSKTSLLKEVVQYVYSNDDKVNDSKIKRKLRKIQKEVNFRTKLP